MRDDAALDTATEAAWRTFRIELGDRLSRLQRGDAITVTQPADDLPDGPRATVGFTVTGAQRIRATVATGDLPFRGPGWREPRRKLIESEWRQLRTGQRPFIVERGRRSVDEMALIVTRALREIWAVMHPAFLAHDTTLAPAPVEPAIIVGTVPGKPADLIQIAAAALRRMVNQDIVIDRDGDIPIPTEHGRSWLRACYDQPQLELFTTITHSATDRETAAHFIAANAARWPGIVLHLDGYLIHASLRLEASVFFDGNLASALSMWIDFDRDAVPEIRAAVVNRSATGGPQGRR